MNLRTDDMGISALARAACCAEDTVRRLDKAGIIHLRRDSAGRRLGGAHDVVAIRAHLSGLRSVSAGS